MLHVFSFHSKIMNQTRTIRVYLPTNDSASTKQFPVLYMHDGQNIFRDEDAIGGVSLSLEKVFDNHQCQTIVVGIDSIQEQRIEDYCPWQMGEYSQKFFIEENWIANGEKYIAFITNELKPYIDKHYRTYSDQTAMAGISLGGLISTYAVCAYPAIYQRLAIFSSSFYRNQETIEELIRRSDFTHIQIYMDCGSSESDDLKINDAFIQSNERVAEAFRINLSIIDGGKHKYMSFKQRIPNVLCKLFGNG